MVGFEGTDLAGNILLPSSLFSHDVQRSIYTPHMNNVVKQYISYVKNQLLPKVTRKQKKTTDGDKPRQAQMSICENEAVRPSIPPTP